MSAWIGALKPSASALCGTSLTMPSVTSTAPAICEGGTSSTSLVSSEKSAVPSPSGRSAACTSRTSKPPSASSRAFKAATAACVCAARLPRRLAGAVVDDERDDARQRIAFLTLQDRIDERQDEERGGERAQPRAAHPLPGEEREHDDEDGTERCDERQRQQWIEGEGEPGHVFRRLTARAARAAPGRAPGRPCSCRSACTSRC